MGFCCLHGMVRRTLAICLSEVHHMFLCFFVFYFHPVCSTLRAFDFSLPRFLWFYDFVQFLIRLFLLLHGCRAWFYARMYMMQWCIILWAACQLSPVVCFHSYWTFSAGHIHSAQPYRMGWRFMSIECWCYNFEPHDAFKFTRQRALVYMKTHPLHPTLASWNLPGYLIFSAMDEWQETGLPTGLLKQKAVRGVCEGNQSQLIWSYQHDFHTFVVFSTGWSFWFLVLTQSWNSSNYAILLPVARLFWSVPKCSKAPECWFKMNSR